MLRKFVRIFGGDPNKREIEKYSAVVEQINALEDRFEALSDEALCAKTDEFRRRLGAGVTLDDLLPEAFAAVREASKRTLGQRHYDVQLIGGLALHQGKIAEMRTGEGKTLVATLPLYLNALTGRGVHLVTVNDYLARRDARWMGPIYKALGLSVGVLQMAARTENGKKAFLVDLERESPHEDQHQLRMVPRQEAYAADITYGTNSEFGFDYLRDNMAMRWEDRVQHGHHYAIVDEVDNVLIDEARTPLIISGPAQEEAEWYIRMAQVVKALRPEDYEISERDRHVTLTEVGEGHVEELLGMPLRDPDRPEDVTPEQARLLGYLEQALRAQFLFSRNKDYLVQGGKVVIVDEFTGRLMPGRRWSDGLHQAVEAKEGVRVQAENITYATITIQNYFRMYEKLAGMTGTAVTEAEEFHKIYELEVLAIPTNLEYIASREDTPLVEVEARDEQGYKYQYYTYEDDPEKKPIFWKRKDYPDVVYRTEEAKLRAITQEILRYHVLGRPLLVGTTSVELSERVSNRLRAEPLRRLVQVLLIRDAWFERNNRQEDGRQVPELQFLNAPLDSLDQSAMRRLARDLGLPFNPEDPANLERLLNLFDLPEVNTDRLTAVLKAGISHEVLNARKHAEESQIIARAGAFSAVTIATNMAGRGVDIRLGGEVPESVINQIRLLLRRQDIAQQISRNGHGEIDEMPIGQWPKVLGQVDPADLRSRAEAVGKFLKYAEEEEKVRQLGGLHVIGSERHEARRIDNQLRGRSARQGDPGSSRFYLSMEDELMRLFGGSQADGLMQRLKIDDAMPLEAGLVSRIIEQSQTRVEGANFDMRKHLLEYDDVLNTQRAKIYSQRDRIFTKNDLHEDVAEMLRTEVNLRVPEALKDPEGPWRLLAWLEQIQPPIAINSHVYPSVTLKLLVESILSSKQGRERGRQLDKQQAYAALIEVARASLQAEEGHLMAFVENLLDQTQERLEAQMRERMEGVETFIDNLNDLEETDAHNPRQVLDELSNLVRFSLRLTPEQQRALRSEPEQVLPEVQNQVESYLANQAIVRLLGSIERRLEDSLEIEPGRVSLQDWPSFAELVLAALQNTFNRRRERLLGGNGDGSAGLIGADLQNALARLEEPIGPNALVHLLMLMPQGARAAFDRRTHRRVLLRTTRLTYVYYAAHLLEGQETEQITGQVLEHLERAHEAIRTAYGLMDWNRLAQTPIADLDAATQRGLQNVLDENLFQAAYHQPLGSLNNKNRDRVIAEMGRKTLTEVYRKLLLSVITELWVDYLTQMESLRVSIGLEAYAQRDPLVQYKNRAFSLFQELLNNMRLGVVSRMFTYRPRDLSAVQANIGRAEAPPAQISQGPEPVGVAQSVEEGRASHEKKRKRRRRH